MSKPVRPDSKLRRIRPLTRPIRVFHDGRAVEAEAGEPLAISLIGAGRLLLARSPKLHRPRGPYCLRAACDGCLARVDGEPNTMTCQVRARDGMKVETQNVLGSRGADLLRATDFIFPHGFDHHRLMAGTPILGSAMQQIARRVAGLGRMPESERGISKESRTLTPDVLVVGAGRSGCRTALALKKQRPHTEVLVVGSALEPGGRFALCEPEAWERLSSELAALAVAPEMTSTVAGLFLQPEQATRPTALVARAGGAGEESRIDKVEPKVVVLAVGGHDYVATFEGNDLPGVFSARAALTALHYGVLVGRRVLLAGAGVEVDAFLRQAEAHADVTQVSLTALERAKGSSKVNGAVIRQGNTSQTLDVDAVVIGGPRAPSFELAVQSGAEVDFDPGAGYVPRDRELAPTASGVPIFLARTTGSTPEQLARRITLILG
ncbi:MAG: 2Fe-2S iron-sulfur cluster-binding protein [Polyangiaceae bacterium]